jgi:hypothetical protein
LARPSHAPRSNLVCHARRGVAPDPRRLLICVRQHTHRTVHPPALVREALHLVSLSLARVQKQSETHSDSPRSLCWSRLPGEECLRLWSDPFRARCQARRSGCHSSPLQGGKPAVLQVTGWRLYSLFRLGHSWSTPDVTPKMASAKRKGLADYGLLAQRYVESFEQKWVLRDSTPSDELLGAADIQSLADLGNSYASCVRCARSRSDLKASLVWRLPPLRLSCLSCSRFSHSRNSFSASSRPCFKNAV